MTANYFMLVGCMLLPFSTSPNSGVVFSFGIPFFVLYIIFSSNIYFKAGSNTYHSILVFPISVVISTAVFTFLSPEVDKSSIRLAVFVIGFLVFLSLFLRIKKDILTINYIEDCLVLFGAILSCYYIGNIVITSVSSGFGEVIIQRYVGGLSSLPWGASNVISAVIFFPLTAAIAAYLRRKNNYYLVASVLMFLAILATMSRTGMVLLVAMYFASYFIKEKITLKQVLLPLFAVLVTIMMLSIGKLYSEEAFELLLSDRFSENNLSTGSGRYDSWTDKLTYASDNILDPIGYYASLYVFDGFTAHNYFITTLVEQSITGLIINTLFLIIPFILYRYKVQPLMRNTYKWYLLGLAVAMINLFFEDANFTQPYMLISWIYMSICYGLAFLSHVPGSARQS